MKNKIIGAAIAATAMLGTPAMAQSFTYDVTWEPVEPYGGLSTPDGGQQYRGGAVKGTYVSTDSDGATVNGTVKCVGTGQPPGIFAIHLACTSTDQQGTYSLPTAAIGSANLGRRPRLVASALWKRRRASSRARGAA